MKPCMDANPGETSRGGSAAGGRILALDYGRKRIGVAVSDELGLTAHPLEIVVRSNRRTDTQRVRDICRQHGIQRVVVGQPLHMSGRAGEMAAETARYAARLQKELRLTVELVDERLTSWEAKETVAQTAGSSRRRGEPLDAVAAAVLLRDYLEQQRRIPRAAAPEKD